MSPRPGRAPVPLRIAVRLLPEDAREEVLGDLLERWRTVASERSWPGRVLWLWRQPLAATKLRARYGGSVRARGSGRLRLRSGRRWSLGFSWLDVKLGLRMMIKHPGVSLVIVLALAVGIPASLTPHHLIDAIIDESPPFEDGDRFVGLITYARGDGQRFLRLGDYELLRERLTTFESLGAALPREVNVITDDGRAEAELGALMTASSFALARVPPLKGRTLSRSDEAAGASDVVVIGYDFWRSRLGGDPDVLGTTLRIAGVPTTVVGVMPEGFAMPSKERLWLPMRLRSIDYEDGLGPAVWVYGRLADGVSRHQAEAELGAVAVRPGPDPERGPLRADVVPFSALDVGEPRGGLAWLLLAAVQAVPLVFLLIACGSVGILLLARTVARTGEVAVRTALGASRARIAGQLFVEALLLALVATGAGLVAVDLIIDRIVPRYDLPFWLDLGVTPELVLKALGLAVFSAVVAGVLPALRATGAALHRHLQGAGSGAGPLRFGPLVGALIVVEVGLGVGALFAGGLTWHVVRPTPDEATLAADEDRYLVARIAVPRPAPAGAARPSDGEDRRVRVATMQEELGRRLGSEPGVRGWAFSDRPPSDLVDERRVRVDEDGYPADHPGLPGVVNFVDPSFFDVLDVAPVRGRLFDAGDVPLDPARASTAVIVNLKFLERRGMEPGSSIGRSIRFTGGRDAPPGAWMEIVGVVPNIEASADRVFFDGTPVVYVPAVPGTLNPVIVLVDLGRDPVAFAPRLRNLVAEVDPTALVDELYALHDLPDEEAAVWQMAPGLLVGLSLIAILLSMAALYALMSLTVAQRTREIGIRVALGGDARSIVVTVARRALAQLALGVALGSGFWVVVLSTTVGIGGGDELEQALSVWPYVLLATAGVVVAIGLTACLVPTMRGLRIHPVEALRAEG